MLMIGGMCVPRSCMLLTAGAARASDTDRAAVRTRFAPGDVDAVLQPPDDLPLAKTPARVLHAELVATLPEAGEDVLRRGHLDRNLPLLVPLPARRIEARLRVHPVID